MLLTISALNHQQQLSGNNIKTVVKATVFCFFLLKLVQMSIKTSYLFIITAIVYFLISVIFTADLDSTIDINVHDTYFVISNLHLSILVSIFVLLQGILYLIVEKTKLKLNLLLAKLHFTFTVIFLSILFLLLNFQSNYSNLMWFNIGIVIALLGCILIPTINMIFSVINRRNNS